METDPLADTDAHMHKSIEALQRELATIRTGRANPQMIEHLSVEYYGSPTPLQQLAGVGRGGYQATSEEHHRLVAAVAARAAREPGAVVLAGTGQELLANDYVRRAFLGH